MLVWDALQGAPNIFTIAGAGLGSDARSAYDGQWPQRAVKRDFRPPEAARPRKAGDERYRSTRPRNHLPRFREIPPIDPSAG